MKQTRQAVRAIKQSIFLDVYGQLTIFCFYLQNRLIQTGQTGGQQYSNTSPFSVSWFDIHLLAGWKGGSTVNNPTKKFKIFRFEIDGSKHFSNPNY